MALRIIGVHPIDAPEPCHIIEVELDGEPSVSDWSEITQEISDQPRSNWQVPYDEQPLDENESRWVFFFHYLDFNKPLLTPFGQMPLLSESPLPRHLEHIEYFPP